MKLRWMTLVTVVALGLAGCGADRPGLAEREAGFPMEVRDCESTVTVDRRPEKIMTSGTVPIDLLHAAGASDRIVAWSGEFGKSVPGDAGVAVRDVPLLVQEEPTSEVIINSGADLFYSDPTTGAHDPDQLRRAGITWLRVCGNHDQVINFDDVLASLEMLGHLLGTEDRANASATQFRARLEELRAASQNRPERTAAAISVFQNALYTDGNRTMLHAMMTTLHLRNVFGQLDQKTVDANVEQLVGSDPDVIVLAYGTSGEETFEDARRILTANPGIATMRAVRQNAIIGIPFTNAYNSTRSLEGLADLAKALDALP